MRSQSFSPSRAVTLGILLALFGASAASARTETLRWYHPDPPTVTAYEIHWGTASRGYDFVVPAGLPGMDSLGVMTFALNVTVPDDQTVYVSMTAIGPDGVSPLSNEMVFQGTTTGGGGTDPGDPPDPGPDPGSVPDGQDIPPDADAIWHQDFNGEPLGTQVSGWNDTGAGNSMSTQDSLFAVSVAGSSNRALSTTSTSTNIHSHLVQGAGWSDYVYRGRMLVTSDTGGIGVTAYSQYPNTDSYYRLRRYASQKQFHLSFHPGVSCGTNNTGVRPTPNTWYEFKLEVTPDGSGSLVRAKVWEQGTSEPGWQASCVDPSGPAGGTVGVWSMGDSTRYWDDLQVIPLSGGGSAPPPPPDPGGEPLGAPGRPILVSP